MKRIIKVHVRLKEKEQNIHVVVSLIDTGDLRGHFVLYPICYKIIKTINHAKGVRMSGIRTIHMSDVDLVVR